jgi:hypothetical protein
MSSNKSFTLPLQATAYQLKDTLMGVALCSTNFITKEAAAFLSFKQVTVVW